MKKVIHKEGIEYVSKERDIHIPEEFIKQVWGDTPPSILMEITYPGDWKYKEIMIGNFSLTVLSYEGSNSFYPVILPLRFDKYRIILREDKDD